MRPSDAPRPAPAGGDDDPWYQRTFDQFYLELYARRDEGEARRFAAALGPLLEPGAALEVACGAGRFLRALRGNGRTVHGLDLSRALLAEARRRSPDQTLIRGEMRALPFRAGSFAVVLFLFTSFGYFLDRREDAAALREARRVVRPGGLLVLDFLNAVLVRDRLVAESRREVAGRAVREVRWVDETGPFLRKRVEIGPPASGEVAAAAIAGPRAPREVREERVRLYTPADLRTMAEGCGFRPVAAWGDYDGGRFAEQESERFILLAHAEAE